MELAGLAGSNFIVMGQLVVPLVMMIVICSTGSRRNRLYFPCNNCVVLLVPSRQFFTFGTTRQRIVFRLIFKKRLLTSISYLPCDTAKKLLSINQPWKQYFIKIFEECNDFKMVITWVVTTNQQGRHLLMQAGLRGTFLCPEVMECTLYNFSAFQYVYICKNIKDFISSLSSAFIKLKPHV